MHIHIAVGSEDEISMSPVEGNLRIAHKGSTILMEFENIETIETFENNLSLMSMAMRTEKTMKEGIENGKA